MPLYLTKQGLVEEAASCAMMKCDKVLSLVEIQILLQIEKSKRKSKSKSKKKPLEEGSLQLAYMAIAKLGGFTDSKRAGTPCSRMGNTVDRQVLSSGTSAGTDYCERNAVGWH
ncbi:hypothetical protein EI167_14475 [Pseudoalteromonas prydzensis]|uniref:Uncharacterized protein n=1 Tax=Pseudoalteromonas prydzensis TaxID=182141 RepID=A0ABR9FP85_9GAMM|nr:hypothetical protein [Pseudoalteromonas prydzensis]